MDNQVLFSLYILKFYMIEKLNADQQSALRILRGVDNVFLTGAAGCGKSFLLRAYLKAAPIPILASTGAAAILVGGRTFHSFFGLGVMEGGVEKTVERAVGNKRVRKRLKKTPSVIIDEISMISGPTLRAAERIARGARKSDAPWGGMRIIAVGDFAQLPPVNPFSQIKEWAFLDSVWLESQFSSIVLKKIMRTSDPEFLSVLNQVRLGKVDSKVAEFLDQRMKTPPAGQPTRLFPHRASVDSHNLEKLQEIDKPAQMFKTAYTGNEVDVENFKKHSPIPEILHLKEGALVMLRQNDPDGRWVNGSRGRIEKIKDTHLKMKLDDGCKVEVERADFTLLNADGSPVVSARNFPVSLAWAMTIHKAQGATVDSMLVDLSKVWEPGQAYVALSRVRHPKNLFIDGWRPESIFADPQVTSFHDSLLTDENGASDALPNVEPKNFATGEQNAHQSDQSAPCE
jgi:ATP-dependent DNA helicase PIF1